MNFKRQPNNIFVFIILIAQCIISLRKKFYFKNILLNNITENY